MSSRQVRAGLRAGLDTKRNATRDDSAETNAMSVAWISTMSGTKGSGDPCRVIEEMKRGAHGEK
jgi:hypothetical protein